MAVGALGLGRVALMGADLNVVKGAIVAVLAMVSAVSDFTADMAIGFVHNFFTSYWFCF